MSSTGVPATPAITPFINQWLFVFWGTTFANIIFGFSVLQCFIYFKKHHNDYWSVIALVSVLITIGAISVILTTRNLTVHFVDHFADQSFLLRSSREQNIDDLLLIVTQFLSQTFFAVRIFQVRKTFFPISLLIGALIITTTVLASVVGLALAGAPSLATYSVNQIETLFSAGLGITAVTDCLISLSLVMVLRGFNTDFCQTKNIVLRFTILAVQRGALIVLVVLLWLGFFLANPSGFAWKPYRLVAPGVHISTLVAFLNGRHYSLAHMAKYGHQFDTIGSIGDQKGGSLERRLSIA